MATLGADPEFILLADGEPVPAWRVLGRRAFSLDGIRVFADGALVEAQIPPQTTANGFVDTMLAAKEAVRRATGLEISQSHVARVQPPPEELRPAVRPEFDAYRDGAEAKMSPPPWEMAGGHLHLGLSTELPLPWLARLCDLYVGIPARPWDRQPIRRRWFGAPGRYRPTPYGMEYRSLSNHWAMSEAGMLMVAECAFTAMHVAETHSRNPELMRWLKTGVNWNGVRRLLCEGAADQIEQAVRLTEAAS